MKIFIDTNIFLDFYRSGEDKINVLQNLEKYGDYIVFPEQAYNEFKRNRVTILSDFIQKLKSNNQLANVTPIPIIREQQDFKELKTIQGSFKDKIKDIISFVEDMIKDPTKDIVLSEIETLYHSAGVQKIYITDEIIEKAQRRQILGNPPKACKKENALSAGDEIIWESILSNVKDDLVIVSRDNTYQYNFDFLKTEFEEGTGKKLQDITTTIKDALQIVGKPASSTIQMLEDEQIKEINKFEYPIIIDNEIRGYAPLDHVFEGQENIRFCYRCLAFTKFSGTRCTLCGLNIED